MSYDSENATGKVTRHYIVVGFHELQDLWTIIVEAEHQNTRYRYAGRIIIVPNLGKVSKELKWTTILNILFFCQTPG